LRRRSIEIDDFNHGEVPIPVACRVDHVVHTSAISGYDRKRSAYADGAEAQTELMFQHLRRTLEAAGATTDDVVRMTFYVNAPELRPMINREWLKMFPDPASRPARHILNYATPKGCLVQCEAIAIVPPAQ
jgi:enamine deaminase RidA (YjgF/YER057c/UK114 family)